MKKYSFISLLTVGIMVLSTVSCGKEGASNQSSLFNDTAETMENDVSEATSDSSENQNVSEKEIDNAALIQVVNHKLACEANGKSFSTGSYPEIILSDDIARQYPKLKEELSSQNSFWKRFAEDAVSDLGGYVMNDDKDSGSPYYYDNGVAVLMLDDRIFSAIEYIDEFSGGAHPNHWKESVNIDPVTGNHLEFKDVLKDPEYASKVIKNVLYEAYPDMTEEFDLFINYTEEEGDVAGAFLTTIYNDTFTWALLPEGLNIFFSPYEVASYVAGDFEVLIPYDKYPELVQNAYIPNNYFDSEKMVAYSDGLLKQLEVSIIEKTDVVSVPNKSWNAYTEDGRGPDDGEHITISKVKEEKTDWLDTETWADEHGFELARRPYSDDYYKYVGTNPMEYEHMSTGLEIYDVFTDNLHYSLDLYALCNGPDEESGAYSSKTQFIRWATIYDGTLYVSIGHRGYAYEEPNSSYIVAIAPDTGYVLWRSQPLVSNADNFQIVKDTIICGYGFTDEDDYIYLLDRFTGQQMDKIKVNSGPDQFEVVGDTLYVATYNTAYKFEIQ